MRNFESIRLAEKQAEIEAKQQKEEEENNPMKILENRTRDSRREMAVLETLEDLRELNAANAGIDPKILITAEEEYQKQLEILQKEEDEKEIKRILSKRKNGLVNDDDNDDEDNDIKQNASKQSKQIKIEPEEKNDVKASSVKLFFPKSTNDSMPFKSSVGLLKKDNVTSFIKKKPAEAIITKVVTKPENNAIASLCSYGSSDSDGDEN